MRTTAQKDLDRLMRAALACPHGWQKTTDGRGHYRLALPDGTRVSVPASTSDVNCPRNVADQLKAACGCTFWGRAGGHKPSRKPPYRPWTPSAREVAERDRGQGGPPPRNRGPHAARTATLMPAMTRPRHVDRADTEADSWLAQVFGLLVVAGASCAVTWFVVSSWADAEPRSPVVVTSIQTVTASPGPAPAPSVATVTPPAVTRPASTTTLPARVSVSVSTTTQFVPTTVITTTTVTAPASTPEETP